MRELIFYNYETQTWEKSTDTQTIKMHECLQELALYRGESWFWSNYGADYEGLFRGEVDITAQVLNIIDKYTTYFKSIETQSSRLEEDLLFSVNFIFESGEAKLYNVTYSTQDSAMSRFSLKINKGVR